jgi:hypothetical protein
MSQLQALPARLLYHVSKDSRRFSLQSSHKEVITVTCSVAFPEADRTSPGLITLPFGPGCCPPRLANQSGHSARPSTSLPRLSTPLWETGGVGGSASPPVPKRSSKDLWEMMQGNAVPRDCSECPLQGQRFLHISYLS